MSYYLKSISNSPFNVTVTCPVDKTKLTTNGVPQWITNWGNSKRDIEEEWEDGNVTPNDGWSDTWTVENGYVCTGGSSTTKDVCSKFVYTVTPSPTPTPIPTPTSTPVPTPTTVPTPSTSKPSVYTISHTNQKMTFVIWISVFFCLIIDVIFWVMTNKYSAGVYVSIEHIQLLAVLPVAGSYFTKVTKGLFHMMRSSLLGFDSIDFWSLFKINPNYSQDDETLEYLGFASNSAVVNLVGFVSIGVIILMVDTLIFRILRLLPWSWNRCTKLAASCRRFRNWTCIGLYIRYLLLGFMLILVSSMHEVNNFSVSTHRWSWSLSVAILLVLVILLLALFMKWLHTSEEHHSELLDELTWMLKFKPIARLYPCLFLLHRMLIWITIWIDNSLSTETKLILLICIQGVYLMLMIWIRPFILTNVNASKIVCDASVFVVIVLMYCFQNSSDWSSSTEYVFMYTIMVSILMPCLITAGNGVSKVYSCSIPLIQKENR